MRQDEARCYLGLIVTDIAHGKDVEAAPEFDDIVQKKCPEAEFAAFLMNSDLHACTNAPDFRSGVIGGKIGSVLSNDFEGIDDAAFDVFDSLSPLQSFCDNSKSKEMIGFIARQERYIIELLDFRGRNRNWNPSTSFWANNSVIPPACAGVQCRIGIHRYVEDYERSTNRNQESHQGAKRTKKKEVLVFNPSDYNTYSVAHLKEECRRKRFCNVGNAQTLWRYLQHPEKAKLMYDPDDMKTWSNDDLRIYLSRHGKLFSGNHATLLERC